MALVDMQSPEDATVTLAQLILRTLSKDRNDRPASAAALHDELDAIVVTEHAAA